MAEKKVRSPIVVVLGHVDHGKTTLLDKVRGTAVQLHEAGGMTQHIGASFIPMDTIFEIIKPLSKLGLVPVDKSKFMIPGLLFIDTPGHEAFTNLRRRGSSVADIAILVVDIRSGFQPQTYESIELLKATKTPFIVAANKIDRLPGWKSYPDTPFLISLNKQDPVARRVLEEALDRIILSLYELNFEADRYDRVKDFRKTVAIVPTSAKTGEGIADLFLVLVGVTQRFMQDRLKLSLGEAKGSILEVRRMPGAGTVLDVILYDGVLRKGDWIILGGKRGVIITRVRGLLLPKPLDEIRDPRDRFDSVEEVVAAAGVRIIAPELEDALAGSPLYAVPSNLPEDETQAIIERYKKAVLEDIGALIFRTDKTGIILKADTLGSLEALLRKFRELNVPVAIADVGDVDKEDAVHATVVKTKDPKYAVIVTFNVNILPEAKEIIEKEEIPVISDNVIYKIFEKFNQYLYEYEEKIRREMLESITYPGKIMILPGYVFRRSKPAIVGVRVLGGKIKPRYGLIREDGKEVGTILQIQSEGESISEATAGMEVAISIDKGVVDRNIKEGMILYVDIPEHEARLINRKLINYLPPDAKEVFKEFLKIKRKTKYITWGM
ncbi:MAG: translation initiation factor IF-2 [Candidatus Njordarchaeales archaeon]